MTYSDENRRDTLKFRLLSPSEDLGSWGHEYMRHLALEIGQEYEKRMDEDADTDDLLALAHELVPFFLKHNAEADAVDILSELEDIENIPKYLDENTYSRVGLYMVSMVPLLAYPDNDKFLRTAFTIYEKYGKHTQALALAIRLNSIDLILDIFRSPSADESTRRQMAFILGRQRISIPNFEEEFGAKDENLIQCLHNENISEYFRDTLAKELNIEEPKIPEDIYKTHLESSRTIGLTNTDSARHNLASTFVNAFVNLGFSKDKLMLTDDSSQSWIWKTKDEGQISATASMGMILQWNVDEGLSRLDQFIEATDDKIKAGALLALGLSSCGVRGESDPILAVLADPDFMTRLTPDQRVLQIMGIGLAYAGSNSEDAQDVLLPYITERKWEIKIQSMAALALGLVFVGSAHGGILEEILGAMMFLDEERPDDLKDKWSRFIALGVGLLCFGRQEEVDVILEALKAIDHPMSRACQVLAEVCAWAGTGAVIKIQELLHMCNEPISKESDKDKDKDDDDDADEGDTSDKKSEELVQAYAVLGLALVAMGEDIGQDMILRQFGHLMHYGEPNIRKVVPLAMALVSPSNPQMKVYDTLSRYSHDNDLDVAINAIFAMGLLGAGTNNARLAQLLRQLASYYHRDPGALFMVRISQGLLHMGKGTVTVNPFHTDRQALSRVAAAGLLAVAVALIDAKDFVLKDSHYLFYLLAMSVQPRWLITVDEELQPIKVNVRVGTAVDVVGQVGKPKTITGWQTQSTPVLLGYGERAELEDEEYLSLASTLEGVVILKKV
jgi:26S proteasome regulatory subunit N1